MSVRRNGRDLVAWVENDGGLSDVRATVRLGSLVRHGGKGVRIPLPEDFDRRGEGVSFSVGFLGRDKDPTDSPRRLRRWAGGLPYGLRSGSPGRLFPRPHA